MLAPAPTAASRCFFYGRHCLRFVSPCMAHATAEHRRPPADRSHPRTALHRRCAPRRASSRTRIAALSVASTGPLHHRDCTPRRALLPGCRARLRLSFPCATRAHRHATIAACGRRASPWPRPQPAAPAQRMPVVAALTATRGSSAQGLSGPAAVLAMDGGDHERPCIPSRGRHQLGLRPLGPALIPLLR